MTRSTVPAFCALPVKLTGTSVTASTKAGFCAKSALIPSGNPSTANCTCPWKLPIARSKMVPTNAPSSSAFSGVSTRGVTLIVKSGE